MNEEEFNRKYVNLRILKNIQEYLKKDGDTDTAVYPIKVPNELLYQTLKLQGPEHADKLIHHIFKLGLNIWSDQVFKEVFGNEENLKAFIELVKEKNK